MKVLYDHETFSLQDFGGISSYFVEIIKLLKQRPDFTYDIPFLLTKNIYLPEIKEVRHIPLLDSLPTLYRQKIQFRINQILSLMAVRKGDFDIFHPTYLDPYFVDSLNGKPFVVSVMDLTHELYPNSGLSKKVPVQRKIICDKADKVICISENTKNDLIKFHNTDPSKIEIINLAGDNILRPDRYDAQDFGKSLPKEYILYVGAKKAEYKNFTRFLRAVGPILRDRKNMHLFCVGTGEFTEVEQAIVNQFGFADRVINIPPNWPLQYAYYAKASLFVYPSIYEGFGIPIVESFFANCPVALSNASCFPEVAQDAGFYFDPESVESMTATMIEALDNNEERKRKIALGAKRAPLYTWKNNADKTYELYKSLL